MSHTASFGNSPGSGGNFINPFWARGHRPRLQVLSVFRYPVPMTESFDVVVIGAGPTGLACAIEAKKAGFRAVNIDKGCLVNSLYNYPANMVFFTTPELLEIGDIPMTALNEKPVRAEALKYYRRVSELYKLDIRQYQRVQRMSGQDFALSTLATDSYCCPLQYRS